jgi:hypothetical protein
MELYLDCTGDGFEGTENRPDEWDEGSSPGSTAGEIDIPDVLEKLEVEGGVIG